VTGSAAAAVDDPGDAVLDRKLTEDSVTVGLGEGRYTRTAARSQS
jgi:hypothetical protein